MTPPSLLTTTELIATSAEILRNGGYRDMSASISEWNSTSARVFEDEYNVVGLCVLATIADLVERWADLQASLVELMTERVGQTENKSWDGYLVLLTPAVGSSKELDLKTIRYDTSRLRKLVATGEDLGIAGDVERVLRPLLPLASLLGTSSATSALDAVPDLLLEQGIEREVSETIVRAFLDQRPLMEAMHQMQETK